SSTSPSMSPAGMRRPLGCSERRQSKAKWSDDNIAFQLGFTISAQTETSRLHSCLRTVNCCRATRQLVPVIEEGSSGIRHYYISGIIPSGPHVCRCSVRENQPPIKIGSHYGRHRYNTTDRSPNETRNFKNLTQDFTPKLVGQPSWNDFFGTRR